MQCSQAVIGWAGILSSCFVSPRSSTAAGPALSAGQMALAFTCLDSAKKLGIRKTFIEKSALPRPDSQQMLDTAVQSAGG